MMISPSFLAIFLFLSFSLISPILSQHLPLPPLRYSYNALEPILSETQLKLHHLKHHQTYTDQLNIILEKLRANPETKPLAKLGVDELISKISLLPAPIQTPFRNHAGGYINHHLFFRTLKSPIRSNVDGSIILPIPSMENSLGQAIFSRFGSFENFQNSFNAAAGTVFGSGWTFLYLNATDSESISLDIGIYSNQETPSNSPYLHPILCLDEWEHASYVDYQNRRSEWILNWWKILDWNEIQIIFQEKMNEIMKRRGDNNQNREL